MNKERLFRLADYMEAVKPEKINMNQWLTTADYEGAQKTLQKGISFSREDGSLKYFEVLPEGYCGTAACVLGHATFIPEFREAGLKNRIMVAGDGNVECVQRGYIPDRSAPDFVVSVTFGGAENILAASKFFEIPYEDACVLFGSALDSTDAYGHDCEEQPSPGQIARGLRAYVEWGAFWRNEDEGEVESECDEDDTEEFED